MRELELITEARENRALRDINVSKNCSYRELSEPATESNVDDDVPETTISGIRHPDTNIEEKCDNPLVKDIKFNIRENPTSSVSPRSNGTFVKHQEFKFRV